jgi:hypothetical protein
LYFAGGVTTDGALACFDTRADDAEHTSLRLDDLLRRLEISSAGRIGVFLDAAADMPVPASSRIACFCACAAGQKSHRSSTLKHGIWAHHLIQAFDGRVQAALEGGHRLTAASLQQYLATAVPLALREAAPAAIQTPQGDGNAEFLLADLSALLAAREADKLPTAQQVKDALLVKETVQSAKKLTGFHKNLGHAVPDRHSRGAAAFVATIAADDLASDVERVRMALKEAFGFTRRQLTAATHDGAATITTPHFNYNISVAQDSADPANVVWRRSVDAITDPASLFGGSFEKVFPKTFDTIELALRDAVDIEGLIDFIEALRSSEVRVEYRDDQHVTSCVIRLHGHPAAIEVTKNTFSVRLPRAASPRLLVKSFFEIQRALTQEHSVSMIPFQS